MSCQKDDQIAHLQAELTAARAQIARLQQANDAHTADLQARINQQTQALREQRDLAMQIMNNMAQGLTVIDAQGKFRYVNPAYANMLGYTVQDLLEQGPFDFIFPEDLPRLEAIRQERQQGETSTYEMRLRRRDNTAVYVLITGTPRYLDEQYIGSIAVITNLTERRHMEEQLRASEERTRLIIDTALDGVVQITTDGRVVGWNQQASAILGWERDEILGRDLLATVIPATTRDSFRESIHQYEAHGLDDFLNERLEIEALHRDGHTLPVELAITPVALNDQLIFSAFVRDITERKANEAILRRAKEAAEQAAQAKAEFLASMSHEIRTPLNAVIGLTSLLQESPMNREQTQYVETIRTSGQALLSIINDILDYSRYETGLVELEQWPFDVGEFLQETISLLANQAAKRDLTLTYELAPRAHRLFLGDLGRLRQIMLNLVGNGLKFTHEGGVHVRVDTRPLPHSDLHELTFAVQDSGIGIPAERQEMLFKPFTQVDASTTRRYGGTGLGLAICKKLVALMDGHIWVESEPGQGTTFFFTVQLPVYELNDALLLDAEDEAYDFQATTAVRGKLADKHPLAILLVEDDRVNQMVASQMLKRLGYHPDTAVNGQEAVEALHQRTYDLILMDIQMPVMDGLTATHHIRQNLPPHQQPYIVALTANALEGDRERFLHAGMQDYLSKPITLTMLTNVVQRFIDVRTVPPPSTSYWPTSLSASDSDEAVNPAVFKTHQGLLNHELLHELILIFQQEVHTDWGRVERAIRRRDYPTAQELIHKWKGSASMLGALAFARQCRQLETLLRDRQLAQADNHLNTLQAELVRIEMWSRQHALTAVDN